MMLADYLRLRPFAYHVSHRDKLRTLADGVLRTTLSILSEAGRPDLASVRRKSYEVVNTDRGPVVLKDQRPLIEKNVALAPGWTFEEFIRFLNGHVFFWPGAEHGPIGRGQNLWDRYEADRPLVVRVPSTDLLAANPTVPPLFCAFNSGAPRYHQGHRARRGPDLFVAACEFPRRASEVVELVFRGDVRLPTSAQVRLGSDWAPLARAAT